LLVLKRSIWLLSTKTFGLCFRVCTNNRFTVMNVLISYLIFLIRLMFFQSFAPAPSLANIVKCYWLLTGNDLSTQKIVPDGFPELIFHFGQRYQIKNGTGAFERQSTCLTAGQLVNPIWIRPEGESGIVGVKFEPAAFWQLFGVNMHALTNESVNGVDVVGNSVAELSQKVSESKTNTERVLWIEKFLLKQLAKKRAEDFVTHVANEIATYKGEVSVSAIAKKHRVSERQLQRRFNEVVGVSPKRFAKIMRYKNVCSLLANPSLTLSDAVYLAGYFDQSHFNKDFAEFTGENPNQFLSQEHPFSKFFMRNV
jgi:AraC-like DNA-binding protein